MKPLILHCSHWQLFSDYSALFPILHFSIYNVTLFELIICPCFLQPVLRDIYILTNLYIMYVHI